MISGRDWLDGEVEDPPSLYRQIYPANKAGFLDQSTLLPALCLNDHCWNLHLKLLLQYFYD